jgi:hypothetical protein
MIVMKQKHLNCFHRNCRHTASALSTPVLPLSTSPLPAATWPSISRPPCWRRIAPAALPELVRHPGFAPGLCVLCAHLPFSLFCFPRPTPISWLAQPQSQHQHQTILLSLGSGGLVLLRPPGPRLCGYSLLGICPSPAFAHILNQTKLYTSHQSVRDYQLANQDCSYPGPPTSVGDRS